MPPSECLTDSGVNENHDHRSRFLAPVVNTLTPVLRPFATQTPVLSRLPSLTNWQIKEITPKAWAKAHKQPTQKAA
jgi:hypothetical protein